MGKYYKFPRRYYNRNKVRKPLKPKHILQLAVLCVVFYLLCSAFFIGTYRAGSDSMSPWCSSRDTLVAVRTWYTHLDRGDVVLSTPPFYRTAPLWIRALDSTVQVLSLIHIGDVYKRQLLLYGSEPWIQLSRFALSVPSRLLSSSVMIRAIQ